MLKYDRLRIRCYSLLPLLVMIAMSGRLAAGQNLQVTGNGFDFGLVHQNSTYRHQVWLIAPDDDSLRVSDIRTGCGCITNVMTDSTAAPGDSIDVVFLWQTRGSSGSLDRSLLIETEHRSRPVEIKWSANVVTERDSTASLLWEPRTVDFGPIGGSRTFRPIRIVLRNLSDSELDIILVEQGSRFQLAVPPKLGSHGMATVEVSLNENLTGERFESSFTLAFTGNQTLESRVSIPVVHGDFSFRPEFTTIKE